MPARLRRAAAAVLAAGCLAALPGPAAAIVGGGPADPATWGFVVPLLQAAEPDAFTAQFCAASLVAPRWALTAAHCLEGFSATQVQVARPRADLHLIPAEDRIAVDRIAVYPGHAAETLTDDLALVHLTAPAGPTAELARGQVYADGYHSAAVAGWGISDPAAGAVPDVLLSGHVTVLSLASCARQDPYFGTLCATLPRSFQASACNGDSGGPLAVAIPGRRPKLLGVVSYGDLRCDRGKVGVYTDVGRYRSWILSAMRGNDRGRGLPELVDVRTLERAGRVRVQARWCQTGAGAHRMRIDVGLRGEGAVHGKGFLAKLRRRANGPCAAVAVERPTPPAGRYTVTVKVKDVDTGMATPGPEIPQGPVRVAGPAA